MKKLVLMMGISCVGKSTLTKTIKEKNDNVVILSSDLLRKEYSLDEISKEVFTIIEEKTVELLSSKDDVIVVIDATNLSTKKHQRWINIAKKYNTQVEIIYKITHPIIWEQYANNRIKTLWTEKTFQDMLDIRFQMYQGLVYPTLVNDNAIKIVSKDIEICKKDIDMFKSIYQTHKDMFLCNTREFINYIDEINLLEKVIPELKEIIGFNQENVHHNLTLDQHTFNVVDHYNSTEIEVWRALLHDVGKCISGIKRQREDGNYAYLGHAGGSMELSYLILKRLGFDEEFIKDVIKVISLHMTLPYQEVSEKTINKFNVRYGKELVSELIRFRQADMNGK